MLAVEEIVACLFVFSLENPASDFRKHTDFCVFVLEGEVLVVPVDSLICEIVIQSIWIYVTCGSLVSSSVEEIWI